MDIDNGFDRARCGCLRDDLAETLDHLLACFSQWTVEELDEAGYDTQLGCTCFDEAVYLHEERHIKQQQEG